jgi:hypothetical protein
VLSLNYIILFVTLTSIHTRPKKRGDTLVENKIRTLSLSLSSIYKAMIKRTTNSLSPPIILI